MPNETMISTNTLRPAKRFGPGYFIREQMELRNWNQLELAEVTGYSQKHISELLNDKKSITLDTARVLGEVFNTSPQYWINLDVSYRLWLEDKPTKEEKMADEKALIYEHMPVKDMIRKGWLPKGTFPNLKKAVLQYWGMEALDFYVLNETYRPFYQRKSQAYNQYNANYALTWFQKAKSVAMQVEATTYNKESLEHLLTHIADYTLMEDGVKAFIAELKACGVIFFILPHLEKTYLDGAAFYARENPVVVYTARHKRVDNFWFTIAHEIAHVLLHLNTETAFILDNLEEEHHDDIENEANALAARHLKHPEIMDFMASIHPNAIPMTIEMCANELKIDKSIVAGKMVHEKKMHGSKLHLYSRSVLDLIQN